MTDFIAPASTAVPTTTTIELMGKPYQIRCQENEIAGLQKAAQYFNKTLKALPGSEKILAPEKLAILAGLNLASQILELEDQMSQHIHFLNQRLANLQTKLESALDVEPLAHHHPLPTADEESRGDFILQRGEGSVN
jgi:cell division protein ZapA